MGKCTSTLHEIQYEPLINKLVNGYINSKPSLFVPSPIINICINYVGNMCPQLVVDENKRRKLTKKKYYMFSSILIKKNGVLTVNKNAKLNIICYGNIILEQNAQINLDGKGFQGGKIFEGEGPGGGRGGYQLMFAYGGSYGTGSKTYGDKKITNLNLGSGGGGYMDNRGLYRGGAGGGALELRCYGSIIMRDNSRISCNGKSGEGGAGSGSGGSIRIIINKRNNLKMNKSAKIQSIGGGYCFCYEQQRGGSGRIRVKFMKEEKKWMKLNGIKPRPYI